MLKCQDHTAGKRRGQVGTWHMALTLHSGLGEVSGDFFAVWQVQQGAVQCDRGSAGQNGAEGSFASTQAL